MQNMAHHLRVRRGVFFCGLKYAALALLFSALVSFFWRIFLVFMGVEVKDQDALVMLGDSATPALTILSIVFMSVVVSPVAEEFVFRYFLQGWLARVMKRLGFAIGLTALVFAACHLSLTAFMPLVVVSVCCSLSYVRSGSILAPVVTHALFNLVAVGTALFSGDGGF